MGEGWRMLDDEADQAVDRVGGDDVVVVEHEHERIVTCLDLVQQGRADQVGTRACPGTEEARRRVTRSGPDRLERRDEVADEAGEVVVGGVEREPGMREVARRQPAGERRGLAVPRRCGQDREHGAVLEAAVERDAEPRALPVRRHGYRCAELRRNEGSPDLGRGAVRSSRPRRGRIGLRLASRDRIPRGHRLPGGVGAPSVATTAGQPPVSPLTTANCTRSWYRPARNCEPRMIPSLRSPAFSRARCSARFSMSVDASTRFTVVVAKR